MNKQYLMGVVVGPEGVPIASNIKSVPCKQGHVSPYRYQRLTIEIVNRFLAPLSAWRWA